MKICGNDLLFSVDELIVMYAKNDENLVNAGFGDFEEITVDNVLRNSHISGWSSACTRLKFINEIELKYNDAFKNQYSLSATLSILYTPRDKNMENMIEIGLVERLKLFEKIPLYALFGETVSGIRALKRKIEILSEMAKYDVNISETPGMTLIETKANILQEIKNQKDFLQKLCNVIDTLYEEG